MSDQSPSSADSLGGCTPVRDLIAVAVQDRQDFQEPDVTQLNGWVGCRVAANIANRLVKIDTTRLLEGYKTRPGRQSWDGEHVGKWLHAATLAWRYSDDPVLRSMLDATATELCGCQLDDGYLGTYRDRDRWTDWDVWAHKYNLIGLITYVRYTGNKTPLACCTNMADLLCRSFSPNWGRHAQRDIISAGWHVGMAPTSVLEPMVLLYRFTGQKRYLDFCENIFISWEQPHGPHIISTLLTQKRVDKVGNGKAYEMLSCLNGVLEYYRTVGGKPELLEACLNAWQDIIDKRLYITGAASVRELFLDDHELPNDGKVGETCVTVTWLQFNAQLLRLTGEARFAEQLERVVLNQLLGAQRPDGTGWGYYVQMEGRKPYSETLDGHCCLSSGPRGVALIPTFVVSTDDDGIVVNLYEALTSRLRLRDGHVVSLRIETEYPLQGVVRISIDPTMKCEFAIKLRIPQWCHSAAIRINGKSAAVEGGADGYVSLLREWSPSDLIELDLELVPRAVIGTHTNDGRVAFLHGPLVLAVDKALLPDQIKAPEELVFPNAVETAAAVSAEPARDLIRTWQGAKVYRISAQIAKTGRPVEVRLVPFADAGANGSDYRVWQALPATHPCRCQNHVIPSLQE